MTRDHWFYCSHEEAQSLKEVSQILGARCMLPKVPCCREDVTCAQEPSQGGPEATLGLQIPSVVLSKRSPDDFRDISGLTQARS